MGITARELSKSVLDEISKGGGGTVHVGENPPPDMKEGEMWFQTGLRNFDPNQIPLVVQNVIVQDDEPTDEQIKHGNNLWYDLI